MVARSLFGLDGRSSQDPLTAASSRGAVIFGSATIVAVLAAAGFAFRGTTIAHLAIFAPIALAAAVILDTGTVIVLALTWRLSAARCSTYLLALSGALGAVLTFATLLVLPAPQPILPAPLEAANGLFLWRHVLAAAGAFAYAAFRRHDREEPPERAYLVAGAAAAVAAAALGFACASWLGSPALAVVAVPTTAALLALATLAIFRIPESSGTDRSLGFALFVLTVEFALLQTGPPGSVAYFTSRLLLVLSEGAVLGGTVWSLADSRAKLLGVERALSLVEGHAAKRAARIRALWQIAYEPEEIDHKSFRHMLLVACSTIRPDRKFFGSLTHLEGDRIVVDASVRSAEDWNDLGLPEMSAPGVSIPFADSLLGILASEGAPCAWDDLDAVPQPLAIRDRFGWHSFIGAPITVGKRTYFLSFGSDRTTTDEPFAEDDIAYVDVVASFFAARLAAQRQFEQIRFEVEHDALTGLENRVQFRAAVREEIAAGRPFAIAFINLDGFRHVNGRDGHHVGDEVLVEVARALKIVAGGDLVARMSADEFGILLHGVVSRRDASAAIERYAKLFMEPFRVGTHRGFRLVTVRASGGAARFPKDATSGEELMRRASVALDIAKNRGGSTTMVFEPAMEGVLNESRGRFDELSAAIALDQLALVYQPTFDLKTRRIVGAEALVRWDHPERGRLAPSEFVSFAERNGLIGPLSRWVFERAVRDIASADLPKGFRIYLNAAAQMLDDIPFIAKVNEVLRAKPELAGHLGVEVTETAAMQNVERSMYSIELFRRWGMSVAIDDFGTGYSSLSYLKQLTVDLVKIDRSFVAGLPGDERDAALTEMLLNITERFGFETLAEGIETEAQAEWLLEHGCHFGQGYLIARPDSFEVLLARIGISRAA